MPFPMHSPCKLPEIMHAWTIALQGHVPYTQLLLDLLPIWPTTSTLAGPQMVMETHTQDRMPV